MSIVAMTNESLPGALSGLKVVEIAQGTSGPYCGKLLADMGAEVIKLEHPGKGDTQRYEPPFYHDEPGIDNGLVFNFLNTSKLGVTLDLDEPRGRELLTKLVGDADVLLVSGAAAWIDEHGLAFETWKAANPRLVGTYVTPYGLEGPYRDRHGGELTAFHMSAMGIGTPRHRFGATTQRPLKFGGNQALMIAGLCAANGTMHALFAREATGSGQRVDVSEVEPFASFQFLNMARWAYMGDSGEHGFGEGARRFWTANGAVTFMLFTGQPQQLEHFKDLLGRPEWLDRPEFQPLPDGRVPINDEFLAHVNEWAAERRKEDVYREAQDLRVALFPENTVAEALDSSQIEARGFLQPMPLANGESVRAPVAAYQNSATPARIYGAAPTLGRDNEAVWCTRLGVSKEELERGTASGLF
jgi:crotonobetainyl-CoA:carnitine CoA-transferase CaiB-like acyl-CoA transferase